MNNLTDSNKKKKIFVLHPDRIFSRKNKKILREPGDYTGFNLPESVLKKVGDNYKQLRRIELAEYLENIFTKVARSFSEEVSLLQAGKTDSISWWVNLYHEKNGWPSEHITQDCILNWIKNKNNSDRLILITDQPFFAFCLDDEFREYKVSVTSKWSYFLTVLRKILLAVLEIFKAVFYIIKIRRYFQTNNSLTNTSITRKIVLKEIVTAEQNYREDGLYDDTRFGNISNELEQSGFTLVNIPNLSVIKDLRWFSDYLGKIKTKNFLVAESTVTPGEIIYGIQAGFYQLFFYLKLGKKRFLQAKSFYVYEAMMNYFKSRFISYLKSSDINPDYFIFNWENKSRDKSLLFEINKHFSGTISLGFFLGITYPTAPEMLAFEKELQSTLLPDKIILSGEYNYRLFRNNGYPEKVLGRIGAVRYGDFYRQVNENLETLEKSRPVVLILFPLHMNISSEIYELLTDYFDHYKDSNKFRFLLKEHPFLSLPGYVDQLKAYDSVSFTRGTLEETLKEADICVYSGPTSSSVQAMIQNIYLLRYSSKNYFNLDCLAGENEVEIKSFKDSGELFSLLSAIKLSSRPLERNQQLRKLEEYFPFYREEEITSIINKLKIS